MLGGRGSLADAYALGISGEVTQRQAHIVLLLPRPHVCVQTYVLHHH